jgi:hypothetical protein
MEMSLSPDFWNIIWQKTKLFHFNFQIKTKMKKLYFLIFIFAFVFYGENLCAQMTPYFQYSAVSITPVSTPTSSTMPIPTVSNSPTSVETIQANVVEKPEIFRAKLSKMPTSIRTPTFTYTSTATYTPTRFQTPTPVFNCVFVAMGDSWVCGDGAGGDRSGAFANVTAQTLKIWYPGITYENDCNSGTTPAFWIDVMPGHLEKYSKKYGLPIGYVLFETGLSCVLNVNNNGDDSCKGASFSQGVSASYVYQKEMDKTIGDIYAANPNVHLVVLDIPDRGLSVTTDIYQAYRQRLYELKFKYPKMRIADIYQALMGHEEWFRKSNENAVNHPNDLGQIVIAKCILAQFANWPYQPKH